MKYKYKRNQIFGKRLKVPKDIQKNIYGCVLSFEDFIKYDLVDKIPVTCLKYPDRDIVSHFGVEVARNLDWETIRSSHFHILDELLEIDPNASNINELIYQKLSKELSIDYYTPGMREYFAERIIEPKDDMTEEEKDFISRYNHKYGLHEEDVIYFWDLLKDADLSYFFESINRYSINKTKLTEEDIKRFMASYRDLLIFIPYPIPFIATLMQMSEEDRPSFIKETLDKWVQKHLVDNSDYEISSEQRKEILKYYSFKDLFEICNINYCDNLLKELESLSSDYIDAMPIPLNILLNWDVCHFANIYGLQNIIAFDNECGGFFSQNDFEMLLLMNDMYVHYAANEHDPEKSIFTKKYETDEDYDRLYTKDEFYEAMRRMIVYGPSDWNYASKAPDYRSMTGEFRERFSDLFIADDAPEELKSKFYTKKVTPQLLREHPEFIPYIMGKNYESFFQELYIHAHDEYYGKYWNFYTFLMQRMTDKEMIDFLCEYGDVISAILESRQTNRDFTIQLNASDNIEDIKAKFNEYLYDAFVEYGINYPKYIPDSFKKTYPDFFVPDSLPQEIKDKFYSKKLTIDDFYDNDLLDKLGETNIALGFSSEFSWIIKCFIELPNKKLANYNRLKIIFAYSKIQDAILRDAFREFVSKENTDINMDNIDKAAEVLYRLSMSNSSEIFKFRGQLAKQILDTKDPIDSLDKIEDLFVKNNIPTVGKLYSCFDILHPDFGGFTFDGRMSPTLKRQSVMSKKITVFSDLIRASLGSNNRSINSYLNNIEVGYSLYLSVKQGNISMSDLSEEEKRELHSFRLHLATLHNNTLKGKIKDNLFNVTDDVILDIDNLIKKLSPNGSIDYNLPNRVISMFAHFAGFDTLEEAKAYVKSRVETTDKRNRRRATMPFTIEVGDFIKGIDMVEHLGTILQNGSVSKEFLGADSGSDATPLDTDLSRITVVGDFSETIQNAAANAYGNIIFVLKCDDRFTITRDHEGGQERVGDKSKLEAFYTGVCDTKNSRHYGIRTGFSSSDIDYIVLKSPDKRVFFEIALNGFYIPVVNMEGQIIFTPEQYDEIRSKMSGLNYYGIDDYQFSSHLELPGIEDVVSSIDINEKEVAFKRDKINKVLKEALSKINLKLKTAIDGDLSEGVVELIDTGSTGRGTNASNDGDFDFMMRLDRSILSDSRKLAELKSALLQALGGSGEDVIGSGDFRLKGVKIDDIVVDIDISFINKTDKVTYSTDMSLQDRLETIKRIDPVKYKYVLANILLAKKLLKEAHVYKPNRGDNPEGGLGGVGIENWILQNGGSLIDAIDEFLKASEGKEFEEFRATYVIWDFGENHFAEKRGHYPHDDFIYNMSAAGYEKMIKVLKEFKETLTSTKNVTL